MAHVSTPFDDPHHPYGQWTVRLSEEGLVQVGLDRIVVRPRYRMEFIADEPLSKVEKDMTLGLFHGVTHLATLTVLEIIEPSATE